MAFLRKWRVAALLLVVCIAVATVFLVRRHRADDTPEGLASFLPASQSTLAYADVGGLRRSGMLDLIAGSKAAEEPEYKDFVSQTHFDYRSNLDAVAASFAGGDVYFALRGGFDWDALSHYVTSHGGSCTKGFCRIDGSRPERRISFYPITSRVMALAISSDASAASRISRASAQAALKLPTLPAQPVWVVVPAPVLKNAQSLPAGTHAFASALQNSEKMVFAIGPSGQRLEVSVDVTCKDPETATALLVQLEETTSTLRKWLAREHQTPNQRDLSGVLTAGTFRREDRRVFGQWPLERAFVEALAGNSY
jgi:hypothetical protein